MEGVECGVGDEMVASGLYVGGASGDGDESVSDGGVAGPASISAAGGRQGRRFSSVVRLFLRGVGKIPRGRTRHLHGEIDVETEKATDREEESDGDDAQQQVGNRPEVGDILRELVSRTAVMPRVRTTT